MSQADEEVETILIVDDEESVRKTFREWLENAGLHCRILTAADAETALVQANQHTTDLAILDWNLGAGNDGLRLLEDLYLFNPDVVAIMITGFAHQATPLDAMRMGVRDYLDKNQDLDRETFLAAVRRQLERIGPTKRERRLHRSLVAFREAVEKVLPLVQAAAALNDPVPLPEAVRRLLGFLLQTTGARAGVLLVHSYDPERQPAEVCRVYDAGGKQLAMDLVPFAHSVAGTVVSLQEPYAMSRLDQAGATEAVELQPFERDHQTLLAAPMAVAPGIQVVLELFDKQAPGNEGVATFTAEDQKLIAAAADFGAEMLRQALAERQMHQVLFDAVDAALGASDSVADSLRRTSAKRSDEPPPAAVLDRIREGLSSHAAATADAEETLRLAEAVRVLALRHGPAAVTHCIRLVESVRELLDGVTGESRS
ncbi:MAG TPA: response regulator [Gemmataceae bacterium]|nr:response regulator [Gemmataceae bacterium]